MARKSRKHPGLAVPVSKDTVGYIRLSVLNRDSHGSVENQKFMIEEWGRQHQIPIMRYYIDNGFSGKRFDRPAFQEMLQDIRKGKINCVVVKTFPAWGETTSLWVITLKCSFLVKTSVLYQLTTSLIPPMV